MGDTHFRSNVKEQGTYKIAFTNASIVTATINTLNVTGNLANTGTVTATGGLLVGSGKYIKLGSIYIITGAPTAFTSAGIDLVATLAAGVANSASIPRGSLFLNASAGATASQLIFAKAAPSTWSVVTLGSQTG